MPFRSRLCKLHVKIRRLKNYLILEAFFVEGLHTYIYRKFIHLTRNLREIRHRLLSKATVLSSNILLRSVHYSM